MQSDDGAQGAFFMNSPTNKPAYDAADFECIELSRSSLGQLLSENDRNIDEIDTNVRVLSERSAKAVWDSTFGSANHKAAIAEENWTSLLVWTSGGDWLTYFNNAVSEPVETQLRSLVDWADNAVILFIKGPCDCVVTDWQTFIDNWLTFLEYDDDGPFVIPVEGNAVLRISPIGTFLKGVPRT